MIFNATINGITPPPTITADGSRTEDVVVSKSVRCFVDGSRQSAMTAKANLGIDSQATLYAPISLASLLVVDARVTYTLDGVGEKTLLVAWATTHSKGSLSHVEALLKLV